MDSEPDSLSVHVVTRLRLDAQLSQPASPPRPKQMERPCKGGQRVIIGSRLTALGVA